MKPEAPNSTDRRNDDDRDCWKLRSKKNQPRETFGARHVEIKQNKVRFAPLAHRVHNLLERSRFHYVDRLQHILQRLTKGTTKQWMIICNNETMKRHQFPRDAGSSN